jgi:opacity protein-like surface antigen
MVIKSISAMLIFIVLNFGFLFAQQSQTMDEIHLKKGGKIIGIIIEKKEGESVTIQIPPSNETMKVLWNDINTIGTKDIAILKPENKESLKSIGQVPDEKSSIEEKNTFKINFSVGGNFGVPLAPSVFSDYWQTGYGGFAGIEYSLTPTIALILGATYTSFSLNVSKLMTDYNLPTQGGNFIPQSERTGDYTYQDHLSKVNYEGGTASILDMEIRCKYSFLQRPNVFTPYALGGIGLTSLNISDFTGSVSYHSYTKKISVKDSETYLSASLGAGIDVSLSERAGIFAEGLYVIDLGSGDHTAYLPIKVGVRIEL